MSNQLMTLCALAFIAGPVISMGMGKKAVKQRIRRRRGPAITGLSIASITVPDYDEAIAWYKGALGLSVSMDNPSGNGERWVVLAFPGGKGYEFTQVALVRPEDEQMKGDKLPTRGRVTNLYFNTNDCRAMARNLAADGAVIIQKPTRRIYGTEAVWQDPFGNIFTMVESAMDAADSRPRNP